MSDGDAAMDSNEDMEEAEAIASQSNTPAKSKKRKGRSKDDDGDEEFKKKQRPDKRELTAIPQIGLGENSIARFVPGVGGDLRRVFFLREDLCVKGLNTVVHTGPYDDRKTLVWWSCEDVQREFAMRFAVPMFDNMQVREIESDVKGLPAVQIRKDYCSAALFAFMNTHHTTHLNIPRTAEIQNVCLPQFQSDKKSRLMIEQGPEGGAAGVADCLLWKLSVCADTLTVDEEILTIITMLCRAIRGGLDVLYPAVATEYTEVSMCGGGPKNKVQEGLKYYDMLDRNELQRRGMSSTSNDIDDVLLQKIIDYRCARFGFAEDDLENGANDERIIPRENAVNDQSVRGENMPQDSRKNLVLACGLFNVFLWSHVMDGFDGEGHEKKIRIDLIRLQAKAPGVEPILFLQQCSVIPEITSPLMNVVKHMAMCLGKHDPMSIGLDHIFSAGEKFQFGSMCSEAHVPLAVFKFASAEKIYNVHLGGMRMDVRNREEMNRYNQYLQGVERARCAHHTMVYESVRQDLAPRGINGAHLPLDTYHLQFYQGLHYRFLYAEYLDAQIEDYLTDLKAYSTGEFERQAVELSIWRRDMLQSEDKSIVYVAVGGGLPWNCGILVQYNPNAFAAYVKPGHTGYGAKKLVKLRSTETVPQPAKCAPVIEIYLESRGGSTDAFECLWNAENDIVMDLHFLKANCNQLGAVFMNFVEKVHDVASSTSVFEIQQVNIHEQDIYYLYGMTSDYKLKRTITNTRKNTDLRHLALIEYSNFQQKVSSALSNMVGGRLTQWAMAARVVLDLKRQEKEYGAEWFEDHVSFRNLLSTRVGTVRSADLLNSETHTALFVNLSRKQLNLDICFWNKTVIECLNHGSTAQFCSTYAWGVTVQMTDCASTVSVMLSKEPGVHYSVKSNVKSPGAGADISAMAKALQDLMYGRFICSCRVSQRHYLSKDALDKTAKWITPFAMTTYNGSGLIIDHNGEIDEEGTRGLGEAGLMSNITEAKKLQSNSDTSKGFMKDFENFAGDSGAYDGLKKENWNTTNQQKSRTIEAAFPMPVALITGNVQDNNIPASSLKGGRIRGIASSCQDGANGVVYMDCNSEDEEEEEEASSEYMRMNNHILNDKTDMKKVGEALSMRNRKYSLLCFLRRKSYPFLNRVMKLEPKPSCYVHSIHLRNLNNLIAEVTGGLRRSILKDGDVMSRTWDGPFTKVTLFPSFVTFTIDLCIDTALNMTYMGISGKLHVPLYKMFENCVISTMNVPISFLCMLNALHIWLFATIYDVNVMVLSCYMMFACHLQQNCPLHVLALVCNEQELTFEQEQRYNHFAEYLMEVVTSPCDRESESRTTQLKKDWMARPAVQERGIALAHSSHLQEVTRDDLITWHNWTEDDECVKIRRALTKRQSHNSLSCYVRPAVEFVVSECPEWMRVQAAPQNNSGYKPKVKMDVLTQKDASSIIATAFGAEQTILKDEARARKEAARRTSDHLPNRVTPMHERTNAFWKAAKMGVTLPKNDEEKSQDHTDLEFPDVWTTPVYYIETMRVVGTTPAIVKQFCVMCGLKSKCSRLDLVRKILMPYMHKKNVQRKFIKNNLWEEPIFSDKVTHKAMDCYRWGAMPYEYKGKIEGVQVSLNMDIAWFIVAQGLFAGEWNRHGSQGAQVVVHLRNIASANLVVLSVILHTLIEKSAIPSNDGTIPLNHPNPFMAHIDSTASVVFDPRLHCDNFYESDQKQPDKMLCQRFRRVTDFHRLVLDDGSDVLYYKSILQSGEPDNTPESEACLFPYPPESVYHMHTQFETMKCIYKRVCNMSELEHSEKTLLTALILYARSVNEDMTSHIPSSLTHCVTADQREVPCFGYQGSFLFVLKVQQDNTVRVVPVTPTHMLESKRIPLLLEALPLSGEDTFGVERMTEVMCSGFKRVDDRVVIKEAFERTLEGKTDETMQFTLFPVIGWKHAVQIKYTHQIIVTDASIPASFGASDPHLRLVDTHAWFEYLSEYMYSESEKKIWLSENEDLSPLLDTDSELHVAVLSENETSLCVFFVTREACHNNNLTREYYYFNDKAHLKHVLTVTDGKPFSDSHCENWVHRKWLVAAKTVHCTYSRGVDHGMFLKMYALSASDDGIELVGFEYDDSTFIAAQSKLDDPRIGASKRLLAVEREIEKNPQNAGLLGLRTTRLQERDICLKACDEARVCVSEILRMELGEKLETCWVLGPQDYWAEGQHAIGIIKKHPHSHKYLENGRYYIECDGQPFKPPSNGVLDFMTTCRGLLREGQPVFLYLNQQIYKELRAKNPKVRIQDREIHDSLVDNSSEGVQLRAFYILGSPNIEQESLFCVRLLILVYHLNVTDMNTYYYSEDAKHKMTVNVSLHRDELSFICCERDRPLDYVEHLILQKSKDRSVEALDLGPEHSILW